MKEEGSRNLPYKPKEEGDEKGSRGMCAAGEGGRVRVGISLRVLS